VEKSRPASLEFFRRPLEQLREPNWSITRVKGKQSLSCLALSKDLIGCYVHYARGRSQPCIQQESCEWCQTGVPRRWHSWFGAVSMTGQTKSIVEITLAVMPRFDEWIRQNGTLRGTRVDLARAGKRDNGRLMAMLERGQRKSNELPGAPAVAQMLRRMWDLPETTEILETQSPNVLPLFDRRDQA
jgi:hypothetical protein